MQRDLLRIGGEFCNLFRLGEFTPARAEKDTIMKTNRWNKVTGGALLLIAGMALGTGDLLAQKGPKGKNGERNRGLGAKRADLFDPAELGAAKGKYEAWRRGVLGGDAFYTKKDAPLRATHALTYTKLRDAMIEDRLTDEAGGKLVDELIAIGQRALELRGEAERLEAGPRAEIDAELKKLVTRARAATENSVPTAMATPNLNRKQVNASELIRFGADTGMLSTGQLGSLDRKSENLGKKEAKAKEDKEVSDRERENLVEDARELMKDLVKDLTG